MPPNGDGAPGRRPGLAQDAEGCSHRAPALEASLARAAVEVLNRRHHRRQMLMEPQSSHSRKLPTLPRTGGAK